MIRAVRSLGLFALLLASLSVSAQDPDDIPAGELFPASNPWNWDITGLPVHPGSAIYIASIGASKPIREDYAFPYSVVDNTVANVPVDFDQYPGESDPGPGFNATFTGGTPGSYPIPPGAQIEPGADAHVLVVDTQDKLLYELYATTPPGANWIAGCGAIWKTDSNDMREEGWTSADAAGLPILPGLIRYDEAVTRNLIPHALRFTCAPTQNAHIFPARHDAGVANINLPPMGLRLRLKASKDISGYTGAAHAILTALKKHGMILADNGSDFYISTTLDSRWHPIAGPDTTISDIRDMVGSDFEVVQTVDDNGVPLLFPAQNGSGPPPPPTPTSGGGGGGGCGALGLEGPLLLLLLRSLRRRDEFR